jgi:KAP family P-loop domain
MSEATDQTPVNHWEKDRLSRKAEAQLVLDYMLRRLEARSENNEPRSYVLNIDAPWGSGKTFFLKCLKAEMEDAGYLVAYVNAWEHDHGDDAMLPILSSIKNTLAIFSTEDSRSKAQVMLSTGSKIAVHFAKGALNQFTKKYLGTELGDVTDAVTDTAKEVVEVLAEKAIKEIEERVKLVKQFHEELKNVVDELGSQSEEKKQLFVFIDELDRCRPTYAIETLERVKHILNADGIAFIIATDTRQLAASVSKVYGQNFDGFTYLRRFFDRQYELNQTSKLDLIREGVTNWSKNTKISIPSWAGTIPEFMAKLVAGFKLTARDTIQLVALLDDIIITWPNNLHIELAYLAPLAALYHSNRKLFEELNQSNLAREEQKKIEEVMAWDLIPERRFRDDRIIPSQSFYTLFQYFYANRNINRYELINNNLQNIGEIEEWVIRRMQQETNGILYSSQNDETTEIQTYFDKIRALSNFK